MFANIIVLIFIILGLYYLYNTYQKTEPTFKHLIKPININNTSTKYEIYQPTDASLFSNKPTAIDIVNISPNEYIREQTTGFFNVI